MNASTARPGPRFLDEDNQPVYLADPATTRYVPCTQIRPGQVIAYLGKPRVLVLRTNETCTQRVCGLPGSWTSPAHWCRALDGEIAGREGWMPFGPGGQMPIEINTDPLHHDQPPVDHAGSVQRG